MVRHLSNPVHKDLKRPFNEVEWLFYLEARQTRLPERTNKKADSREADGRPL